MTWPIQPLLNAGHTPTAIQRATHLSGTAYQHAIQHGLTDWHADRAAIRLGHHPLDLWPNWIDIALDPVDRIFVDIWAQTRDAA